MFSHFITSSRTWKGGQTLCGSSFLFVPPRVRAIAVVDNSVELGGLLCDSLVDAQDASTLQFAISSTEVTSCLCLELVFNSQTIYIMVEPI